MLWEVEHSPSRSRLGKDINWRYTMNKKNNGNNKKNSNRSVNRSSQKKGFQKNTSKKESDMYGSGNASYRNASGNSCDRSGGGQREVDGSTTYRNSPDWYYTNPAITDSAIRINFEEFVGKPYQVTGTSSFEPLNVLAYYTQPTPNRSGPGGAREGAADDPGALWAARKLYSALSSVTGRTSNYTPNTLCFLNFAMGELLSSYSFIRRVFGYYRTFNRRNWGIPKSLFSAMAVDYLDFQSNIANYLTEFNTIITDMNKLPILASVTYLQKCVGMYDYVYSDYDADMAQLFMFCPASTWYLREDGSSIHPAVSGTVMQTVPMCITTGNQPVVRRLGEYIDILRNQLKYLMESSTLNIVYSDILNYASKNGTRTLVIPYLTLDYAVNVIYNESICQQMHHSMQLGDPVGLPTGESVDANGFISFNGRDLDGASASGVYTPLNDIIEVPSADSYTYLPMCHLFFPTSGVTDLTRKLWDPEVLSALMYDADNMVEDLDRRVENTRYMVDRFELALSPADASEKAIYSWNTSGDHGIVSEWMFTAMRGNLDNFAKSQIPVAYTDVSLRPLTRLSSLNLPPLMWVFNDVIVPNAGNGLQLAGPLGDLKNTTFISNSMLRAANKLIERDLFDVRDLKGFTG
nr:putative capsid [Marmot picobirnavirus]